MVKMSFVKYLLLNIFLVIPIQKCQVIPMKHKSECHLVTPKLKCCNIH